MIPTYSFLKEKLPSDTLRIIDAVLPYLEKQYSYIDFNGTRISSPHRATNNLLLLLRAALTDIEMRAFLARYGINERTFNNIGKRPLDERSKAEIVSMNCDFIPVFKDKLEYETLYPSVLLTRAIEDYNNLPYHPGQLSGFDAGLQNLLKNLKAMTKLREQIEIRKLEKETYGDLPISVINYLETASKIRCLLLNSKYDYYSLKNVTSDDDITALSLFIALYNYEDVTDSNNKPLSTVITKTLSKLGVKKQDLNIKDDPNFLSIPKNVTAISRLYSRYFREGCNEGKELKDITVLDICDNLFDRNFTRSLVIEKALSKNGIDINDVKNFKQLILDSIQSERMEKDSKDLETFYSRTNSDTRDFLSFSAKVYTLLLKKMEERKHNSKILSCEDDADTLSLLISSYFFETDVSTFFKQNGISLNDISNLIGIELTREEIDLESLDRKVLINRFQRFATDGVNSLKESKKVTINEISNNLCNRLFNRTTIMEDIFNILNNSSILEPDFLNRMKEEIDKKEKAREASLAQEIFKNSSAETISFYENVSIIHQYLERVLDNKYTKEDIRTLSLLIALLYREDSISEVFNDIGINYDNLLASLKIRVLYDKEPDIDVIHEDYLPYIKKVHGKDDIGSVSMYEIAKNLFSKEDNKSIRITRLLGSLGLSYDDFESFEEDYKSLAYKSRFQGYDKNIDDAIADAIRLFSYFHKKRENGKLNIPNVETDDDIVTLSLLIPLLYKDATLEKYGIPPILDYIGMTSAEYREITTGKVNYKIGHQYLSKFIGQDKHEGKRDILKRLLNKNLNESHFIESLLPDKTNFKALKYEMETGQDYESSLSIEDRIIRLKEQQTDPLDIDNISSITEFGNSLREHAKYIYDELPRLEQSDSNEKSVESIKAITTRVYDPSLQRRNVFQRLFSLEPRGRSQKITINQEAMGELRTTINENIVQLSGEVRGYDTIRRYLEVYKEKNERCYQKLKFCIIEVEEKLAALDPKNDVNEVLKLKSILAILKDKASRFATTISIAEQSLIRIYQSIVSHSITINSLDMAKTDLFPLIGAELAISQGKMTERGALELTGNVIALFNSLLTGNIKETEEHMRLLRKANIPQELLEAITRDVTDHYKEIAIGEQLGELSSTPLLEDPKTKRKINGSKRKRDA